MPGSDQAQDQPTEQDLKTTPLDGLHRELGAKMVPFAGYAMPVQYGTGVLKEHLHTRASAGLFDVSHMGQVRITGDDAAAALEALVPGDIAGLDEGQTRYTLFTNGQGGILDDLMVTRVSGGLYLVINAACKDADIAHLRAHLDKDRIEVIEDHALLALQGPKAVDALGALTPGVRDLTFMTAGAFDILGAPCFVTRSGYTGEDGFEISVPADKADELARRLLDHAAVEPIGLGARDSLRLEAGLCLYGNDIDETTTPVEAALSWAIGKRRREDGGFPGADVILGQLADGAARKRVGFKPEGRAPARAGTEIQDTDGNVIGEITSGGFGPSVEGPVAMGYVAASHSKSGTAVNLMVRGKVQPAVVANPVFVEHNYVKS